MTERVLLVDLENVQKIDLSQVPGDARVMIFYLDKRFNAVQSNYKQVGVGLQLQM